MVALMIFDQSDIIWLTSFPTESATYAMHVAVSVTVFKARDIRREREKTLLGISQVPAFDIVGRRRPREQ